MACSGQVREGAVLYSSDGKRMGRVVRCASTCFEVEYGFFFPKDFVVQYDEIIDAKPEKVTSCRSRAELLEEWRRSLLLGDHPPESRQAQGNQLPGESLDEGAPVSREFTKDVRQPETPSGEPRQP